MSVSKMSARSTLTGESSRLPVVVTSLRPWPTCLVVVARVVPRISTPVSSRVYDWKISLSVATMTNAPAIMFDAVNTSHLPKDALWVAGYVDGHRPTFASLKKSHPKSRRVSIATSAASVADVLDVENGDAIPQQVPGWVVRMRAMGRNPVVYTSRSEMGVVESCCTAEGVAPPHYWIADWTGEPHLVSGSVATQWANGSSRYPGYAEGCDTSLVSPNFPSPFTNRKVPTMATIATPTKKQTVSAGHTTVGAALVATSVANTFNVSPNMQAVLTAIGGLIIAVERWVSNK